jgi:putative membrane protein
MIKVREYILLILKGMSMGAADVVPGVSGGTIALITGIYRELIDSLRSIDIEALRLLIRFRFRRLWSHINGTFLLLLFTGILISVFSLARLMKLLLQEYPIYIWSFFFGLIIASAVLVIRSIKGWSIKEYLFLFSGIVIMVLITRFTPADTTEEYWFIFIAGAIAICAMILPGISGAFILLILGKYQFILTAVSEFNIPVLLVFGLGIVSGLLSFSRFLSFLLSRYYKLTIAMLAGFIVGSLSKIWPWKETISTRINSHGELIPFVQKNVLPGQYSLVNNADHHLVPSILLMVLAICIVILLDRIGKKVS